MDWAIETSGITKYFPRATGWQALMSRRESFPAVQDVSLSIRKGELFGLLGPNGAGKTTLIKMLSTLIVPSAGTARVNGYTLEQEQAIKACIGLVTSDERSFYWRLSGRQNLAFFAALHQVPHAEIQPRVQQVLEQVELLDQADKRFYTYSTGMRQRLCIARALLNQPQILFLDEPTKGLDPMAALGLHNLIQHQLLQQSELTIVLTTHQLDEAQKLCDRIAIMNRGRIQACGTMEELSSSLGLTGRYQIRVCGLSPKGKEMLTERFPKTSVESASDSAPDEDDPNLIEYPSTEINPDLNDIMDLLRSSGARLHSIAYEPVLLENIFSRHAAAIAPESAGQSGHQMLALTALAPAPLQFSLPQFLRTSRAFFLRDVVSELSYRMAFILQFSSIFFSVAVFYFISRLFGPAAAPYLQQYGGDYFSFVLIGIAFAGFFGVGLSSFSSSLRQAQTTGTLEAMLTTPTPVSALIIGSSLWDYFMTTFRIFIYLAIGSLFASLNLSQGNIPGALVVLALTVITFGSLGILAASVIMVIKRGDPLAWAVNTISGLLGGVYYPLEVLPPWLQWFSRLLPITYALDAMRLALLQNAGLSRLLPDLLALAVFCVILLPLSLLAFRYAVRRARIEGSLTHY